MAGALVSLSAAAPAEDVSSLTNAASLQSLVQRARGGQADAMFTLANFLSTRGDATNAVGWYRAGAERGDPRAQRAFAECLASGKGLAKNLAEAARWSSLAAVAAGSNSVVEAKVVTNAPVSVAVTKISPPVVKAGSDSPATGLSALLAAISPAPLKVAAREAQSATNSAMTATAKLSAAEPEPTRWRIPPEEVGDGIHFPRATDLPPLTPTVQDEPAVVRPPEVFR